MAAKKNNKIIIIIVVLLLAAALIAVIFLGKKAEEPAPVSADETLKESVQEEVYEPNYVTDEEFNDILDSINSKDEPVVVEEFENGDKVVMDATGETYIEPEYSPDLVEVARQWADKSGRKFADDNDMVMEFMADDAYIDYIINGTIGQEEEPVQQPQKQPQQQPTQQGNQGQQQQQQPTGDRDINSMSEAEIRAADEAFDGGAYSGVSESGSWDLPDNVHVE